MPVTFLCVFLLFFNILSINEFKWEERCITVLRLPFILSYCIYLLSRYKFTSTILSNIVTAGRTLYLKK